MVMELLEIGFAIALCVIAFLYLPLPVASVSVFGLMLFIKQRNS